LWDDEEEGDWDEEDDDNDGGWGEDNNDWEDGVPGAGDDDEDGSGYFSNFFFYGEIQNSKETTSSDHRLESDFNDVSTFTDPQADDRFTHALCELCCGIINAGKYSSEGFSIDLTTEDSDPTSHPFIRMKYCRDYSDPKDDSATILIGMRKMDREARKQMLAKGKFTTTVVPGSQQQQTSSQVIYHVSPGLGPPGLALPPKISLNHMKNNPNKNNNFKRQTAVHKQEKIKKLQLIRRALDGHTRTIFKNGLGGNAHNVASHVFCSGGKY